jgi:hypothetical protein
VASVTDPDFEFPSPTRETIFILYYRAVNIEVRLWKEPISLDPQEIPFKFAWKFLSMTPQTVDSSSYEELKKIVCEALKVFKQFGIKSERTAVTVIECINFEGDM